MRFVFSFLVAALIGSFVWASDDASSGRAPAAMSSAKPDTTNHNGRNYPGGRDEEDLRVQEALVPPVVKVDRQSIESKVLKVNMKVDSEEPEATEQ